MENLINFENIFRSPREVPTLYTLDLFSTSFFILLYTISLLYINYISLQHLSILSIYIYLYIYLFSRLSRKLYTLGNKINIHMKRNIGRPLKGKTLTLFEDQADYLDTLPNASKFVREELDKILLAPLTEIQIAMLKLLNEKSQTTDPYTLMRVAKGNGLVVSTMQCDDFIKYHSSAQSGGGQ